MVQPVAGLDENDQPLVRLRQRKLEALRSVKAHAHAQHLPRTKMFMHRRALLEQCIQILIVGYVFHIVHYTTLIFYRVRCMLKNKLRSL
jgi:hypothetical protein